MKKAIFFGLILFLLFGSCTQKSKEPQKINKIENTLKSVNLLYDSTGTNPSELLSIFERVNKAIDSIGYPDAGYKLWSVQGDSIRNFRFMLEGHWPDQAVYDSIHNNPLYKNAWTAEDQKTWNKMKIISYNRFTLVR